MKCHDHDREAGKYKKRSLAHIFEGVKKSRRGDYDSILGLSGGADSSYVYHLARSRGLRPLLIHLDNGWDLPIASENIERLTEHWGDTIHSKFVDLDAIHRSFFLSGLPDIEVPTDHAIRAITYDASEDSGVTNILSGMNYATESHASAAWTRGHRDWRYIKNVCKEAGVDAEDMPHYTITQDIAFSFSLNWITPLNYIPYNRMEAVKELARVYGWSDYGGKHQESRITRFVHGYILPKKFGYDTRRSRLSAMICSGQLTVNEAFAILLKPAYDPAEMLEDKRLIIHRWGIPESKFDAVMNGERHNFREYPSYASNPIYLPARALLKASKSGLGRILG